MEKPKFKMAVLGEEIDIDERCLDQLKDMFSLLSKRLDMSYHPLFNPDSTFNEDNVIFNDVLNFLKDDMNILLGRMTEELRGYRLEENKRKYD